jgi:hypothetical protein
MRSKQWYIKTSQPPKSLVNNSIGHLPTLSSDNKIIRDVAGGINGPAGVAISSEERDSGKRSRRCRSLAVSSQYFKISHIFG